MLAKIVEKIARRSPEKTAIVCGSVRMSYGELDARVKGLSCGLSEMGIRPNDCVAILLPNSLEFVVSFFAIAGLNAIVLPLNHLFREEELTDCMGDSKVKAIITDRQRVESCDRAISKLDRPVEIIVIDDGLTDYHSFSELTKTENVIDENDKRFWVAGDVLYQYSSGSTGRPKRMIRTQYNLYHEVKNFAETVKISEGDRILCTVPMYHAHGLGNCMLAALCNGATLVILESVTGKYGSPVEVPFVFRRLRVLELIETEKITIFPSVPYILNTLAETPESQPANLSSLRLCFSAGNFLAREIFDKFRTRFNVPIRQLYGCTEAGSVAINLDADPDFTFTSVGRPMNNVELKIIDENGNELPPGEVGEVVIHSQSMTRGYANFPALNKKAFRGGYFFTGDLGKKDEAGRVFITGRKKLLIDTGGRKVDPIEVEDILLTHPKIKEAVVVGVKGDAAGEIVKAVIVCRGQEKCSDREITAFCRERLAEFKIPKIIEFRREIPKSPLGKVLRQELVRPENKPSF